MKFSTTLFALLSATTSALGAAIVSPTAGQVLSASQPFNLTFASQRYFKESSNKIDVVISQTDGSFPGALVVRDMLKTSSDSRDGSSIYSVMVTPQALCCGGVEGNRTLYVLEDYNAFGGNPGLDMLSIPVTFQ
ncbi:hypothetical protein B0H15DRAFT_930245 [Mycena belliarum]|uniref:Uncharacterized protein n=1 Tax=Mycena belliarum TaxID=1033014 RepID=A0AAD6U9P4_9AGAR|nr:hypothetical protein B0H15DRAFT_930245 [Mycena belliae]